MKKVLVLATLLASFAFGKPLVYVLATGGTIAGSAAGGATDTAYTSGAITVDALLKAVPQINDIAVVKGEANANPKISLQRSHRYLYSSYITALSQYAHKADKKR